MTKTLNWAEWLLLAVLLVAIGLGIAGLIARF